ncbi:hypothetical protein JG687_00017306 [Phytophthora cactorum]|uniref:Uncharacterized protein n=1 Tax=Phytophthora cactorum TaxID=29920 RepID=A0A8T1TRV8_9STRA|nr:hypothetical protein JG687_00017306 [Phytophthora cactorum]
MEHPNGYPATAFARSERIRPRLLHSTQLLQHQTPTIDTDGLIAAVETAFGSVSYRTLDKCFFNTTKSRGYYYHLQRRKQLQSPSCSNLSHPQRCHTWTLRLSITVMLICTNQSSQPIWFANNTYFMHKSLLRDDWSIHFVPIHSTAKMST